jgi:hypothetical protein
MITDTDIKKMRSIFVTKNELKSTEKRIINKVTDKIIDRINRLSDYFDEKYLDHEKRIINLEHRISIIQPAQ